MFRRYAISPSKEHRIHPYCDCIVIGSGIAGLSTAIRLSQDLKVKILTKSSFSESTTWYAQGGIAAAIKKPDSWKDHYADTIKAGQGLCDTKAVKTLVKNAPRMIEELVEIGVNFDISGGEISLTVEGGHSYPRILHAGGDATGEELERKLVSFTKKEIPVDFKSGYFVTDVITHRGRSIGVIGMDIKGDNIEIHPCSNVILACGGIGQLFELSTNPEISTGDGIAMAFRAKASIKDIEFMQFHPTVFKTKEGKLFLITEALRGEGAYLRDHQGNRFMKGRHPRAELAPRDIVVKEMVKVMKETKKDYIELDATHLPLSMLKVRFPNIIEKLKENGLDLKKDLIKVAPAAHYLNGGIRASLDGKTDIEGLYACGETSATGAHGANRLASNSLIEGLVFGWKISMDIISKTYLPEESQAIKEDIFEVIKGTGDKGPSMQDSLDAGGQVKKLQEVMTEDVGILRDSQSLREAAGFVDSKLEVLAGQNLTGKDEIELLNMLTVASLIIKAADLRKESRGTHQRNDYPSKVKRWRKHIILKGDKISFEPVD